MELDALSAAIGELVEVDAGALGDQATVVGLERELSRLEAVVARATAAFDACGAYGSDGAKTAANWIATRCRLPKSEARRQVRQGRALSSLPVFARAFFDGEITASHVDAVLSTRSPATKDALARDEELLTSYAKTLSFDSFVRVLSYFSQLADPDGSEAAAEARRVMRDVFLTESLSGTYLGKITLDEISGTIVASELARLEQALFQDDWAKAKADLGRDPKVTELERTGPQRRADARVEMATRSRTAPRDGKRPVPLFSVLVSYETLIGRVLELANRRVVTPGSLVRYLDQADLERAVFSPPARVEIGERSRIFKGATRRAIEVRDQGCTHPYCDEPAPRCQVDHIIAYAKDGPTTQENGRLLCGFHNRLRNGRPPPPET